MSIADIGRPVTADADQQQPQAPQRRSPQARGAGQRLGANPTRLQGWLQRFEWLRHNQEGNLLYCATCEKIPGTRRKYFTHRVDALIQHANTQQHQASTRAVAAAQRQQSVIAMARSGTATQLTPLILSVRYIVNHSLPLSHVPNLVDLMAQHAGATSVSTAYLSEGSVREMLSVFAEMARERLKQVRAAKEVSRRCLHASIRAAHCQSPVRRHPS